MLQMPLNLTLSATAAAMPQTPLNPKLARMGQARSLVCLA